MTTKNKRMRQDRHLSSFLSFMVAGVPLLVVCGLIMGSLGGLLGVYLRFAKDLPDIPDLRRYRPKTVSTFYAEDGTVIGAITFAHSYNINLPARSRGPQPG